MPITIDHVDHQTQRTTVTAKGSITRMDIEAHLVEESGLSGLAYRELIDASGATANFDATDARKLVGVVRHLASQGPFGPTAIIVSDDVSFGMIRMLGTLLDDVCALRPFRVNERAEAEQWLEAAAIAPQK